MGIGVLTGNITTVAGEHDTAPATPLLIMGALFAVVAAMALVNLLARRTPILRCFCEGIECTVTGSIAGARYMPRVFRLFYAIVTLKGFQTQRYRAQWGEFRGAAVDGVPMMYTLVLDAQWIKTDNKESTSELRLPQVLFKDSLHQIANTLNGYLQDPGTRSSLARWK